MSEQRKFTLSNNQKPDKKSKIMKTLTKFVLTAVFVFMISVLLSQTPPPPNGGQTPSESGNTPVGGGAAIGGGIAVLLVLGAGYGLKKVFKFSHK